MAKKGKSKISKVKRNNQTTNKMKKQGKLKLQRHRQKVQKQKQPIQTQPEYSSESESSSNEWADMLDEEEQQYIATRLAKQPQLLSNVPEKEEKTRGTKRKKKEKLPKPIKQIDTNISNDSDSGSDTENSEMEDKYEQKMAERPAKRLKPLLPIKTGEGVVEQTKECEDSESEKDEQMEVKENDHNEEDMESTELSTDEDQEPEEKTETEEVTAVELLAARRDKLKHEKLRIGALCSSLLESPEKKLRNLYPIMYLMEEKLKDGTLNLMSVRKLAMISAAEVFKDIIPDYKIRHQDYSDIKLKKDTLALYKYEKELVELYKRYLQKLEKTTNVFRRKKGDSGKPEDSDVNLGLVSLRCMCSLLASKPNFNFATNIAQSVVPLLGCRAAAVRDVVTDCCEQVFTEDSKGEITLAVVRLINQLVKKRCERLPANSLHCLLSIDFRDVELDRDSALKHKRKQDEKHKKRIVNLSKKEKKRAKKLKEVERELLETEAQENESARKKLLTEVTKTVFQIYFRVLKTAPYSPLITSVLDGLAKFGHIINLEYYTDLVSIMSGLLRDERVSVGRRLRAAGVALALLAAADLALDPGAVHAFVYGNAMAVHVGSSPPSVCAAVACMWAAAGRGRGLPGAVAAALGKRAAALALQLPHHAALAMLAVLRHLLLHCKSAHTLLDPEEASSCRYSPLVPSPEHCGAAGARLAELCALRRHQHPAVRAAAAALLLAAHKDARRWPDDLAKLTPMQILEAYDGSQMSFKPAIPPPQTKEPKSKPHYNWASSEFKEYCTTIEDNVDLKLGMLDDWRNK